MNYSQVWRNSIFPTVFTIRGILSNQSAECFKFCENFLCKKIIILLTNCLRKLEYSQWSASFFYWILVKHFFEFPVSSFKKIVLEKDGLLDYRAKIVLWSFLVMDSRRGLGVLSMISDGSLWDSSINFDLRASWTGCLKPLKGGRSFEKVRNHWRWRCYKTSGL